MSEKNPGILPVGTAVRSYDFQGTYGCYVEGVIEGYGGDVFPSDAHYRIKVTKRVWDDKTDAEVSERERTVYPPFMGMFGRRLVYALDDPELPASVQ